MVPNRWLDGFPEITTQSQDYNPSIFFFNDNEELPVIHRKIQSVKKDSFDKKHFNQLIAERKLRQAADYADQFRFDDIETQRNYENEIINLRNSADISESVFRQMDADTKNKSIFLSNLYIDGGLDRIRNNPYAQQFNELKRKLGSSINREANTLMITFDAQKQYGLFNWDWISPDNDENNINNFYQRSGLNETILRENGVQIISENDGSTSLKFDKSNPYANRIITNVFNNNIPDNRFVRIRGYDSDGEITDYTMPDSENGEIYDHVITYGNRYEHNSYNITNIANFVNGIKESKNNALNQIISSKRTYNSIKGGSLFDGYDEIQEAYESGQLTDNEYNRAMIRYDNQIKNFIRNLTLNEKQVYSNYGNDNDDLNLTSLKSLSNEEKAYLENELSATDVRNINVNACTSYGMYGALITINAIPLKETEIDNNNVGEVKRNKIEIFIPGLMAEEAQARINRNTSLRAERKINDMQTYNFNFTLNDGSKIIPERDSKFYFKDRYNNIREITSKEATRLIDKTYIIQSAKNLKYQFMNSNGDIINSVNGKTYDDYAKEIALQAVNDWYPNVSFGSTTSVEEVFSHQGSGNKVKREFAQTIPYDVEKKYNELYDIYNQILLLFNNSNTSRN